MIDTAWREHWNASRTPSGGLVGHYESWFLRANDPSRPRAFWIRYTSLCPDGRPEDRVGELWAIWFDRERSVKVARKSTLPWSACSFAADRMQATIGDSTLIDGFMQGSVDDISWKMEFTRPSPPLLLLPESLYTKGFPKAKAVASAPMASFRGELSVGGEQIAIEDWRGSQCHNWGRKHTDRYAWGQVAGFDDGPDVFLECATAKVRIGPLWTPWVTLVVLREGSQEWAIRSLWHGARAFTQVSDRRWCFSARQNDTCIEAEFEAPASAFVGLRYANPPGGEKICLNSKLAQCRIELRDGSGAVRRYQTEHRAAFERLVDTAPTDVPVVV